MIILIHWYRSIIIFLSSRYTINWLIHFYLLFLGFSFWLRLWIYASLASIPYLNIWKGYNFMLIIINWFIESLIMCSLIILIYSPSYWCYINTIQTNIIPWYFILLLTCTIYSFIEYIFNFGWWKTSFIRVLIRTINIIFFYFHYLSNSFMSFNTCVQCAVISCPVCIMKREILCLYFHIFLPIHHLNSNLNL